MKASDVMRALDEVEDNMIMELVSKIYPAKIKNYVNPKFRFRMLVAAAVAVSIIAALGLAAYAISSIHQRRQEELRRQYKAEENNVTSYVEYPEAETSQGVSLVSAINDGEFQRVYVNVSPISYEEAYDGALNHDFWCSVDDGKTGYNVQIPWDRSRLKPDDYCTVVDEDTGEEFSSVLPESWAKNMMETSYDQESQTLTLCCNILNDAMEGQDELKLTLLRSVIKDINNKIEVEPGVYGYESEQIIYGSVSFTPTKAECRRIKMESPVFFTEDNSGGTGCIVGIEIYPTSIKVLVDVAEYESLFILDGKSVEQMQQQADWINSMEDAVCTVKLLFADGTEKRFPGTISAPVENGYIACQGEWQGSVDINAVEAVEIFGQKVTFSYVN